MALIGTPTAFLCPCTLRYAFRADVSGARLVPACRIRLAHLQSCLCFRFPVIAVVFAWAKEGGLQNVRMGLIPASFRPGGLNAAFAGFLEKDV